MVDMLNGEASASLEARFDEFRQSDFHREALIKELVEKYYELQRDYQHKCDDLESEINSRRHQQSIVAGYKRDLTTARQQLESNPFVLALIDGDGAIFQESLMRAGAEGGSEAGHILLGEIRKHIQERHDGAAGHWPIMVSIYCNFEGLSRKLVQVGILKSPADFQAFTRAFNLSQPLFSIIDVGSGKERADHKLKEMFRLFVHNANCKHIIFGVCHDNGYLPNLEPYRYDETVLSRLTLLESTPAERGYLNLGFQMACFPPVFRDDQLPESRPLIPSAPAYMPPTTMTSNTFSNTSPIPNMSATQPPLAKVAVPPSVSGSVASPQQTYSTPIVPVTATSRTQSMSSSGPSTYATIGHLESGVKQISIAPSKTPVQSRYISLNASDQRLDPKLPKADGQSIVNLNRRIKEQKVCNNFHLLGHCANGNKCQYAHGERLGTKEQIALRQKARERVCPSRGDCRDFDCFFGHQCPRENCNWDDCYFDELHDQDNTVAMRLYEDGEIVIVNERVQR